MRSSFTREGHLAYDIAARDAFTFRFEESGEAEGDIVAATTRAEAAARTWLAEHGYAYKNLRSQATDTSQTPLAKRQRRAVARGDN